MDERRGMHMKVVVLSDTHIPTKAKRLPKRLVAELKNCDLIIHAGDWQTIDVYHELAIFANVQGVYGNVDKEEINVLFPEKLVVDIHGYKIGVVHGHGTRFTTERRALEAFNQDRVDCIIYGHSHIPVLKNVNGVLLFNPGSPTDKRRQQAYSYGKLTIEDELKAKHVFFEDKS